MQINHLLTTILLFLFTINLTAQWEWENAEFSNLNLGYPLDGFLTLDNTEHNDYLIDMMVQPDGKTLIFGSSQNTSTFSNHYVLARFDINGVLDASFGKEGMIHLPNEYNYNYNFSGNGGKFILQPTGKILIIGGTGEQLYDDNDILMLRYTSDGNLDSTFGEGGKIIFVTETPENAYTVYQQLDEKIVLAGSSDHYDVSDFFLFRCLSTGVIDTTFGENGYVRTDFGKRDIPAKIIGQPDGKLLVLGKTEDIYLQKSDFVLARYLSDGTLDETFGNKGKVITTIGVGKQAIVRSGLLQRDGKIILVGSAQGLYQPDYAMVRYHADGQLDESFGSKGKVITSVSQLDDIGESVVIQADEKILLAGTSREWASHLTLVRYNSNGQLDYSFGDKGKQRPYFSVHGSFVKKMYLQDDKVILAGDLRLESRPNHDFLIIRFLSDLNVGTINFTLNTNKALVYPNPIKHTAILEYTLENIENLTIQLVDVNNQSTYQHTYQQGCTFYGYLLRMDN